MLRFVLNEAGRLALGLFGAALMAAGVAAVSVPHAGNDVVHFVGAWGGTVFEFAHLRFGESAITGTPVIAELALRAPLTLGLVAEGLAISALIGIPVGLLFGTGPVRRAAAPLIQIVAAAPIFCAGLALAFVASNLLHWPVTIMGGARTATATFPHSTSEAQAILLPALMVGLAGAAAVQLALRRAAAEVGQVPWRTQLRRMGMSVWEIDSVYVTPQILAGLLSNLGEVMLGLLSATAVAEWVFSRPGAADLFVRSVALHDWNVAGAVLFVFASLTLAADFVGRCAARTLTDPGRAR